MGKIGEKLDIDFVISTGDNFYDNGLEGVYDPAFRESFTKIYTAKSLQKRWYSVLGNHDYRGDVEAQLNPLLRRIDKRWANNVDLYINGHDHCLEHIASRDSSIQYLTSGGGSKAWRGDIKIHDHKQTLKFFHDGQGFMSLEMTETDAAIFFYDVFGKVLHRWNISKQLHSAI
ncbi:hypothetical protein PTKIN_Ptkin02bG0042200 [Pterospermum kingtungense]